jgi:hypothetical protein
MRHVDEWKMFEVHPYVDHFHSTIIYMHWP